ncbi:asparagine synthase-related protein [Butyrivibrio sp. LC3010]|uniref:asparagine synthase-related protein n=1 Tax=Butyrivibrio sp. LC3010 TaxID=1280680 RepID=UPI0004150202|nr:asparagine synthetase B family protein [Butyrivibrio sp. LC3010]
MSAIWGHIEFGESNCLVESMSSEYKRKCKLDNINEVRFKNSLIGSGLQIINDEDNFENMPYIVDDGNTIIVADCILDNRVELLSQLFPGYSGIEDDPLVPSVKLLSFAYEKWHYDFVKYIKGIFSIAIYNTIENRVFLCTDRTSSRCLYYYKDNNSLTFSTLLSPIKELYPEISKNEMYLRDFLLSPGVMPNLSSTETPWENVYIIEAGCYLMVESDDVNLYRYYEPKVYEISDEIDVLKDDFLSIYRNAVSQALRTNGEVGIALSGGMDSTSVAALAAPKLQQKGKNLISYTYVPHYDMTPFYKREYITNESAYVREMAKAYPNIETNFTDNGGKSFFGYIDEIIDILEIPFKAYVNLPLLLEIYRTAYQRGCKIFLNGQTGNNSVSFGDIDDIVFELYESGEYFKALKYYNNYCKIAGISRKYNIPIEIKKTLNQRKINMEQIGLDEELINPYVNISLLDEYSFTDRNKSGLPLTNVAAITAKEDFKKILYMLPALSYIGAMETKMGLYTGIVIRDPTRSPEVLDYCQSIPYHYYCYNGIPRYLIRGFMSELLPKCILFPIFKRGIQSTDWIYRLENENRIYELVNNEYKLDNLNKYLNISAIKKVIHDRKAFSLENEDEYLYLFITYIFSRYYRRKILQV